MPAVTSPLAYLRPTLGVIRTILASSTPQANVYFGNKALTVALARLLNLSTAAVSLSAYVDHGRMITPGPRSPNSIPKISTSSP